MRFTFENTKPEITDAELLADIRGVGAVAGGDVLTQRAYGKVGRYSTTAIKNRFGTWKAAVAAAGFVPGSKHDIPEDELFDNLRETWMRLGRQPRKREMTAPVSRYTHHPYVRRFGGWLGAMRAFCDAIDEPEEPAEWRAPPGQPARGPRDPSLRLRFLVMRRDFFKCVVCGRSPATDPRTQLQVDHVLAWSKGGKTEMKNLQTLCSHCNLGKSDLGATDAG
jgi:hypothetical protein